jgi:hypothetical protein
VVVGAIVLVDVVKVVVVVEDVVVVGGPVVVGMRAPAPLEQATARIDTARRRDLIASGAKCRPADILKRCLAR